MKTGEGPIHLEGAKDGVRAVKGESDGGPVTEFSELFAIIGSLNERFQTDFDPAASLSAPLMGELTVKRLLRRDGRVFLSPANPDNRKSTLPTASTHLWGVVTYAVHKL